ncbi:RNA-binding protein S1 [Fructilactobacillus lindneri]|uniref:S1 motif domain-containing protein n=2 Tax=Fructilactobacillus lindneri TaxID=53444 RepID=A0A0R2K3P7_9LACO|nr:S1 domain-containing RNA-binding protein [Fructilactobacillus lindneri]ANZ58589.1 RNA-binding protein S1 [Fructilactobacillus lindneri]KRN80740.1 hypothetical protein IV52_GL000804 [Fructilactobacillus lindneri DSM 20690 = JCM 11027]POG97627.1 RNA-binding protein S1 [Fructilactobacillus lindneri]POG98964.1 RNA-binding protein S1 [Fructilactobacillus lindneri]POG99285.1 RNA-binding protein S1 [Fructilactobacillus lindneri]
MALEVGEIVTGKVSGITGFGAFVDLGNHQTGLVHISEVSDGFVKDVHDILTVGDEVKVKVTKVGDDGKIGLSIRKATDNHEASKPKQDHHTARDNHSDHPSRHSQKNFGSHNNHRENKEEKFDDLLSNFLKESESRMSVIKKNTEGKRGGRGGRRS